MMQASYARFQRWMERLVQSELIRRLLRNSSYLFSSVSIAAGIGMLQGILSARLLGVAAFGMLGTIIMFTSMINKFASFRMGELVVKYVSAFSEAGEPEKAAAIFKIAALAEMLASLVAFGLIWLLSPLGARYLAKDPSTVTWFVIYGVIVLFNLINESSTGLLQISDRFRRMAGINVAQSLFTLALIVLVFVRNGGLLEILLCYIAGKAFGAVGLAVTALQEASYRWGRNWWRAPLNVLHYKRRELAHFAVSTNISASLSLINKDSELLWVSFFRSPLEAGYYKLALALANILQMPVSPLPQVTYPEVSRETHRKNWDNVRYILRQGSLLAGGYTLLAAVGLLFLGRPLIALVYKPEFLPAFPALMILVAGYLVANTFYWSRTTLLALGLPDFPTKINLLLAALKVTGMFLLVPRFGYLASAALLALTYMLGVTISAVKVRLVMRERQRAAHTG